MKDICGFNYIAGRWQAEIPQAFASFNLEQQSASDILFAEASDDEVSHAASLAWQAFLSYRRTTAQQRALFLRQIGQQIEALGDTLVQAVMQETGLPRARVEGERGRTVFQLGLFADELESPNHNYLVDQADPERRPLPKPDLRMGYLPLGPVAVFGASNFPLAFSTAGGDTASALAAGCPVVVKGHPAHPMTSELVTRAIDKAIEISGMPHGVFSLLQGRRPELSQALVTHSKIKAVGFTGSANVGMSLFQLAQSRAEPIPFYGELGSVNPQLVLPQQLALKGAELAEQQADSMFMAHGQFCTSPGVVVLPQGEGSDLYLATLAERVKTQAAGLMLTPGIAAQYQKEITALQNKVQPLALGDDGAAGYARAGVFVLPAAQASAEVLDEIFGPVCIVILVDSQAQMLDVVDALPGQLTASIHAREGELKDYTDLIHALELKVGRLIFNQMPTGVEVCRAMFHGGPAPASTDIRATSVGSQAMWRFLRPICYQNMPDELLPVVLQPGQDNQKIF